jgi:hypothetical protein
MRARRTALRLLSTNLQTDGESDEKHVMVTVSQRRSQLPVSAAHSLAGVAKEAEGSERFRQTSCDAALGREAG